MGHSHEGGIECEATGSDTHIHELEYHFTDCLICNFNFSPTEEITENSFSFSTPIFQLNHCFGLETMICTNAEFLPDSRGPPSFLI